VQSHRVAVSLQTSSTDADRGLTITDDLPQHDVASRRWMRARLNRRAR